MILADQSNTPETARAALEARSISRQERRCALFWLIATAPQLLAIGVVMQRMWLDDAFDAFSPFLFALILVIPALNIRNGIACLRRSKSFDREKALARYGKTAADIRQVVYNCAALLLRIFFAALFVSGTRYQDSAFFAFVLIVIIAYGPAVIASIYGLLSVRRSAWRLRVGREMTNDTEAGAARETAGVAEAEALRDLIYKREKNCAILWLLTAVWLVVIFVFGIATGEIRNDSYRWIFILFGLLSVVCTANILWSIMKKLKSPMEMAARYGKTAADIKDAAARPVYWKWLPSPVLCVVALTLFASVSHIYTYHDRLIFSIMICVPAVLAWFFSRNVAGRIMKRFTELSELIGDEAAVEEICRSDISYDVYLKATMIIMTMAVAIALVALSLFIHEEYYF